MSITISGRAVAGMSIGVIVVIGIAIAFVVSGSGLFTTSKPDPVAIKRFLHEYVNAERAVYGKAPLTYNPQLELIAQRHSEDMAVNGYISHWDSEGKGVIDRYEEAGIICKGSENITGGSRLAANNSNEDIARHAVQNWMNSEAGHRENLLNSAWHSQGFGVAFNAAGDAVYITQNFCN